MSIVKAYCNFNILCFLLNFFLIPLIVSILLKLIIKFIVMKELYKIIIYGFLIIIFLIFNCLLVTSFSGIYINSNSKLAINIIFSIVGSNFLALFFYFLGNLLGKISLNEKICGTLFNISKFFNPLNLSCNDSIKC